ncbi:MAG: hypothetical protein J6S91_02360, partial [Treponema sp.]|nr:hypothetical protein [Treponema sp.]
FEEELKKSGRKMPEIETFINNFDLSERKRKILSIIESHLHDDDWIQNALPCEYLIYRRSLGTENLEDARRSLENGLEKFFEEIRRFLSDN